MQPTEALQIVIDTSQLFAKHHCGAELGAGMSAEEEENEKRIIEAAELCSTFLNAAVPIARFRCYVTVEGVGPKSRLGLGNFTICGTSIPAIKNGLTGLRMEKVQARILLWELQQEKTDMISGYQGDTKTLSYRNWLADIDRHEAERVA